MTVEAIINALHGHKVRKIGTDRYRAICPVCGESNGNTLSVGVGTNDTVLLKCWKHGCDAEDICAAIGLDVTDLFPPRTSTAPAQRRRLLPAGQALDLLSDEASLVAICAANIAHGIELTDDDRARCLTAAGRIAYLRQEATR